MFTLFCVASCVGELYLCLPVAVVRSFYLCLGFPSIVNILVPEFLVHTCNLSVGCWFLMYARIQLSRTLANPFPKRLYELYLRQQRTKLPVTTEPHRHLTLSVVSSSNFCEVVEIVHCGFNLHFINK